MREFFIDDQTVACFALCDSEGLPETTGIFTDYEVSRMNSLRFLRDRIAYAKAHLLVRECAGRLLGCDGTQLKFVQNCDSCALPGHGMPGFSDADIYVSLSHTRGAVAAVASYKRCGIDVEPLAAAVQWGALCDSEQRFVTGCADPCFAFTDIWVQKEAMIKAQLATIGDMGDLDTFEVPDIVSISKWLNADICGALCTVE